MSALPSNAVSILGEARQAYIAVETDAGPHVTPELYTWSDDRLWFATATSTLKARVLETGSPVAIGVIARGAAVLFEGSAEVLDPRRPLDMHGGRLPSAVRALASFGVRNGTDLIGFARDAIVGATERRLPNMRVVIAVTPSRTAVAENDRVVWSSDDTRADVGNTTAEVPSGGEAAIAAFPGPQVTPARWFRDDNKVFIAPDLIAFHRLGGETKIAVVVDSYNGPGPAAKQGVLLRADGVVQPDGWVTLSGGQTVEWDGTDITRRAG